MIKKDNKNKKRKKLLQLEPLKIKNIAGVDLHK